MILFNILRTTKGNFNMNQDEALSEAHYTWCLQDIADYMVIKGEAIVIEDILRVYQHHKLTSKKKNVKLNTESPF